MAVKFGEFVDETMTLFQRYSGYINLIKYHYKSRFKVNSSLYATTELSLLSNSCLITIKTML